METRVENGDPRDVICQMVEKLGADVLVMGSHGYGLIKRSYSFFSFSTKYLFFFFFSLELLN